MSVSHGGKSPRDAVVGQLIDPVGKEIARIPWTIRKNVIMASADAASLRRTIR
jgi:hypothetical protein